MRASSGSRTEGAARGACEEARRRSRSTKSSAPGGARGAHRAAGGRDRRCAVRPAELLHRQDARRRRSCAGAGRIFARSPARGAALQGRPHTGMVGRVPRAAGRDGALLCARAQGERAGAIADAIRDHYKPQGPNDSVPTEPVSVAVALADKLDTLVGFWAIDEKPTGSKDPYALRRAALGVIRIVLENEARLQLAEWPFDRNASGSCALQSTNSFWQKSRLHIEARRSTDDLARILRGA